MALVKANQFGATFAWGVQDADAPAIAGMAVRSAQLKFAPEVQTEATDGEGHVESATESKPDHRMATCTFGGYVANEDDLKEVPNFEWDGRFWRVTAANIDEKKGDYWDATVEAKSNTGIEAPSPPPGP